MPFHLLRHFGPSSLHSRSTHSRMRQLVSCFVLCTCLGWQFHFVALAEAMQAQNSAQCVETHVVVASSVAHMFTHVLFRILGCAHVWTVAVSTPFMCLLVVFRNSDAGKSLVLRGLDSAKVDSGLVSELLAALTVESASGYVASTQPCHCTLGTLPSGHTSTLCLAEHPSQ
jgi:hypothetical protein